MRCQNALCDNEIILNKIIKVRQRILGYFWFKFKMYYYKGILNKIAYKIFCPVGYLLTKNGWKICRKRYHPGILLCNHCANEFERQNETL
jgi:hypothetical protein